MITFTKAKLHSMPDLFQTFAEIAEEAVAKPRHECLAELSRYALRGVDCVVAYDDVDVVGYALYGPAGKFISWPMHMPLLVELAKRGRKNVYMGSHFHLRKSYWGKGVQLKIMREYSQDILDHGGKDYLIWGSLTDELAAYSNSKPGTEIMDGFVDLNGRQIGLRDIAAYLEGTA